MTIQGKWRITEMERWDREAIELMGPAFIRFDGSRGDFRFIAVEGEMDCSFTVRNGRPRVAFTWIGNDECDEASGRGWAQLQSDGSLRGRIYIYDSDDSAFKAVPFAPTSASAAPTSPVRRRASPITTAGRNRSRSGT